MSLFVCSCVQEEKKTRAVIVFCVQLVNAYPPPTLPANLAKKRPLGTHLLLTCWVSYALQLRACISWGASVRRCIHSQSSLTLCEPMDCSSPGSSVHGISQARTLEWVACSSSRGSSRPRDRTYISCLAGGFFTTEPPGKLW